VITVKQEKGTISYTMMAGGTKLIKALMKTGKPQATTTYLKGIVYQNDTLQLLEMKKAEPLDAA